MTNKSGMFKSKLGWVFNFFIFFCFCSQGIFKAWHLVNSSKKDSTRSRNHTSNFVLLPRLLAYVNNVCVRLAVLAYLSWEWSCDSSMRYHKCACSELWSLSWLSSFTRESPVCWRLAAPMPESSEGSSVPFFTFTSSFSRAAAPCCPPFTRFHFIRRFWNQTFTFEPKQNKTESFVCPVAPLTSGQVAYIDSFKYIQS